ncbi:MAG: hypothetical protein ACHQX3_12195, partial [Nitrospirales bacterium]
IREAFDLEAQGLTAEGPRNQAEWARMMAAEMKKQGDRPYQGSHPSQWGSRAATNEKFQHTIPLLSRTWRRLRPPWIGIGSCFRAGRT